MAVYTNNLAVEASIIDPITKVVPVYPVKDAYLSQAEPVFPHGIQKSLILNNSTEQDFVGNKIIMAFDVPKLKDPQYENLISVTLELQCITTPKRDVNIGIKYHIDNDWIEDGTTWLGQPEDDPEYIQMKTLSANEKLLVYDLTDLFTSHNNTEFHLPLTIMEQESNTTQRKVQFYSREAGTRYSPVLKITYAYFAEMMDAKKIDGTVKIRRYVPDNNVFPPVKPPELPGTLEIEGGISSSYFPAKDTIPGVIGITTFDDHKDLEGTLVVRKNIYNFMPDIDKLPGTVTIRRYSDHKFKGKVDVNIYITRKGFPKVDDPPARLPSDGRWVQPLSIPYLKGKIAITIFDGNKDLNGEVRVARPAYLNGHILTPKYHAVLDSSVELPSELDGSPKDWDKYVHANDFTGVVTVRRNVPNDTEDAPEITDGHVSIAKYFAILDPSIELPSELDGKPEEHFRYVHANDFAGTVNIRRNVPNAKEDAPELNGVVAITTINDTKDFEGVVRIRDYDYFPPKKDKEGNPIVPGNITIHEYFVPDPEAEPPVEAPELNGHILVIGHRYEDLGGHISIPDKKDLNCHLKTRARRFADLPPTPHRDPVTGEMVPGALPGKITIDSASNGAYAFIIV